MPGKDSASRECRGVQKSAKMPIRYIRTMKHSRLVSQMASALRGLVDESEDPRLPALTELSKQFGVSRATAAKAVAVLRGEGLVVSRGRGGIWIAGREPRSGSRRSPAGSADRLCDMLRSAIADGVYAANEPLPKLGYFVVERHVSARTVRAAYERLVTERLAYRRGKQWIVGRRDIRLPAGPSRERPVVVIAVAGESTWRDLCREPVVGRFARTFNRSCERHGIQTFPVLTQSNAPGHLVGTLPSGLDEVRAFVRGIRSRLLGVLLLGDGRGGPGREWLSMFASGDRPVVVFESKRHYLHRDFLLEKRNVFRCVSDQQQAVECALQALVEAGHGCAGMVRHLRGFPPDQEQRIALAKSLAEERFANLSVVIQQERDLFWENRADQQTPAQVIRRLRRTGLPLVRKVLNAAIESRPDFWNNPELYKLSPALYTPPILPPHDMGLIWGTHLLVPLFRAHPLTALLALDDSTAVTYYYWLEEAGIQVPGEISLLSFGNDEDLSPLPITSVDFGFDGLGYAAFHLMLDDIPIRTGRSNTLTARPTLVERGSVGRSAGIRSLARLEGEIR